MFDIYSAWIEKVIKWNKMSYMKTQESVQKEAPGDFQIMSVNIFSADPLGEQAFNKAVFTFR